MSTRASLRGPALAWAVPAGVLADLLVRVEGRPGLGVALWAFCGVVALALQLRRRGEPASQESWRLVVGALAFAGALVLRAADSLAVFSLLAAVALLVLAAGRASMAWVTKAPPGELVFSALRVAVLCAAGPMGWGRGAPAADADGVTWGRVARTVLRGTLMALPALFVLAALLMSADPVFERVLRDSVRVDIDWLLEHLLFAAFIAWITAGFLRAFLVPDHAAIAPRRLARPALSTGEVLVALWILNLLFLAFMAVQLRYLFGGASLVAVTAGLSYAEYARRGFFELVAVAALVVPILLLADWAASPPTDRARRLLRGTMLVMVALLSGVLVSAAYRMSLYQNAYGLTELRLYVSVAIVWLLAVFGWLVRTVLRGQRERFVFGGVVAGAACLIALYVVNPHALIARVNLDRAVAGAAVDAGYLQELSADAVPTLLARLESLPVAERCLVSRMLSERWSGERDGGWRTWNLSDWRARRLMRTRAMLAPCGQSPMAGTR
jgi:hypothetical protein